MNSPPSLLVLHLSGLLLLFHYSILTKINASSSTPPSPVLDTDGHQLQAGAKYYIIPAAALIRSSSTTTGNGGVGSGSGGGGGGLALSAKDISCPFYVIQENLESSYGLPARFLLPPPPSSSADTTSSSVRSNNNMVAVSNDVNVVFNAATICVQSTAWKVGDFDGKTRRRYVMSNGVIGNSTAGGVTSWFRIEKAAAVAGAGASAGGGKINNNNNNVDYYYKIVYCPSVCGSCKVVCGELGVFSENGKRWVGLSDDPILVIFKKVV